MFGHEFGQVFFAPLRQVCEPLSDAQLNPGADFENRARQIDPGLKAVHFMRPRT